MPKLNDTQSILLASAAQRDSGSIYPLPESITPGARVANAISKLLGAALIEERETTQAAEAHRTDQEARFGLFILPAGLQAIGIDPTASEASGDTSGPPSPTLPTTHSVAPRQTKSGAVLDLLRRPDGATLPELIEATSWLPHTTRAALTGLRKKGHTIERSKRDDATCYRVITAVAA